MQLFVIMILHINIQQTVVVSYTVLCNSISLNIFFNNYEENNHGATLQCLDVWCLVSNENNPCL